jgi:hypothetical protein
MAPRRINCQESGSGTLDTAYLLRLFLPFASRAVSSEIYREVPDGCRRIGEFFYDLVSPLRV